MKRAASVLGVVLVAVMLGAAPAAADIDQSPNAAPFGPAQCEDGRYLENLYTPGGIVGQQIGTNFMGTSHLAWLALSDGTKVEPLGRPLSPGLEKLTVFCWWADEGSPTGYIGGDILFSGHGRP